MSNSAQQLTATFLQTIPTATIDLQAASDSGTSNTDNITNAASLVFDVTFDESGHRVHRQRSLDPGDRDRLRHRRPGRIRRGLHGHRLPGARSGTVILRLAAGAVTDAAGGVNARRTGPVVTIDRAGPTVTIDQARGQPDPTGSSPIRFAVVFSETVSTFDAADVVDHRDGWRAEDRDGYR